MLFSEPTFFAFFAVYFTLHFFVPLKYRDILIIVGSTVFYGYWNPSYTWVPFLLMSIAFYGAIYIEGSKDDQQKKKRLKWTIALLLLPLFIVKYTDFIWASVAGLAGQSNSPLLSLALPLGISFVTFTAIAYVVNVFKGEFPLERNPRSMAAYILFFPHLIAGPILRPHELIPQLHRARKAFDARFVLGISIFTIGLVKKLVFADQISPVVDYVYNGEGVYHGLEYVLAIYGFSVQIFCDFSGYTDMAIGLAILLRIRLPNNFHRPYAATSLVDFWRRWHVTLSRWLRDYLYIPLGGNRHGFSRQIVAILITMVLGGLWHGANWTFAIWGLIHGLGIALTHMIRRFTGNGWTRSVPRPVKIFITFHIVTVAWVFFRAPNLSTAWRILTGPWTSSWGEILNVSAPYLFPLMLGAVFFLFHGADGHARIRWALQIIPKGVAWPILAAMWALAIVISAGSSSAFIYFDF